MITNENKVMNNLKMTLTKAMGHRTAVNNEQTMC